jgi:predicted DNA binding CopG/RHH family protein
MKDIKLTDYEKNIEEFLDKNVELASIDNDRKDLLEDAAKNYMSKTKNVNIRVKARDIDKIKAKSLETGIPYQTIISSLIHQYAQGKLKISL